MSLYPDSGARPDREGNLVLDRALPETPGAVIDHLPRCEGTRVAASTGETIPCARLLAEYVARPWAIQCRSCKTVTRRGSLPPGDTILRAPD